MSFNEIKDKVVNFVLNNKEYVIGFVVGLIAGGILF